MWSLIENAASLTEAIIITGFTTMVLGYKSQRHKLIKYIIYTLLSFINSIFLVNYIPAKVSETIPAISQLIISVVFAVIFLKGNLFFKFYITFINNYMIFLINIPVMMIFNSFLDGNGLYATVYIQGSVRIAILVITKLLFALTSYCFYKWYQKNLRYADFSLGSSEWIVLLFICAISFAAGLYVFQKNISQYKPMIMTISSLVAFVINGLALYGLFRSAQNRKKEEEIRFYQNENKAMKITLDNYINSELETKKIRHDIKNTALTLVYMIDRHEYETVKSHFFDIIDTLDKTEILNTGIKNTYINAIIQMKYNTVKNKNIELSCSVNKAFKENESLLCIDVIDMCTIIANLLDNAIEAYNDKFTDYNISIKLNMIGNTYLIEVSNPIEKSVLTHNNRLKTSKPDAKNHGLGIKSIKSRAEKYNGRTEFTEECGKFVARVWLMT